MFPSGRAEEKKQKIMKLQFHHSDADEGDTRLAWEKVGLYFRVLN